MNTNRNNAEGELRSAEPPARQRRGDSENGRPGRDCLTHMRMLRDRPDVLANALLEMGITESGDDVPDEERFP